MELNDEALAEWRAHPITSAIRHWFADYHARQVEACKQAAWQGSPWPDDRRLALQRSIANMEGVFEASAADFAAIMEHDA